MKYVQLILMTWFFGQTKGYPYWPAKVIMVNSHIFVNVIQYEVLFFATNETSKFNKSDFWFYYENKLKYTLELVASKHKHKNVKMALSMLGVLQR